MLDGVAPTEQIALGLEDCEDVGRKSGLARELRAVIVNGSQTHRVPLSLALRGLGQAGSTVVNITLFLVAETK
eukprot:5311911-Pyramimonas_sp.AAC.1